MIREGCSLCGAYWSQLQPGTINTMDGGFYCHLNMSAGNESEAVFGWHLNRANVSAACEMVIRVLAGQADRKFSEEIGLNLFLF